MKMSTYMSTPDIYYNLIIVFFYNLLLFLDLPMSESKNYIVSYLMFGLEKSRWYHVGPTQTTIKSNFHNYHRKIRVSYAITTSTDNF